MRLLFSVKKEHVTPLLERIDLNPIFIIRCDILSGTDGKNTNDNEDIRILILFSLTTKMNKAI